MVNQVLERIFGWNFDGEEPNRGVMKKMCLLSKADRLMGSDGVDTCRLTVREPSIGSVDVEEVSVVVVVVASS